MEKRTVLLGSIYTFLDVQGLIDQLHPTHGADHLTCTFDPTKHEFKISYHAQDGEKTATDLSRLMLGYAQQEEVNGDRDSGEIETRKVSLPSDAKLKEDLDKMYRDVDRIIQQEEEEAKTIDRGMLLFPHENAKQSWDLGPKSDAAMYTESFLHDLDRTTCTRVQKSKDTITIFADSEALLAIAWQKILACEETFVSKKKGMFRFDFHVDENELGHFFRFRYPTRSVDLKMNAINRFAARYYELIMTHWEGQSQQYVSIEPKASLIVPVDRSCLWKNLFVFNFGDFEDTQRYLETNRERGALSKLNTSASRAEVDKSGQIKKWRRTVGNSPPQQSTEEEINLSTPQIKEVLPNKQVRPNKNPEELKAKGYRDASPKPGMLFNQHQANRVVEVNHAAGRIHRPLDDLQEEMAELDISMPKMSGPGPKPSMEGLLAISATSASQPVASLSTSQPITSMSWAAPVPAPVQESRPPPSTAPSGPSAASQWPVKENRDPTKVSKGSAGAKTYAQHASTGITSSIGGPLPIVPQKMAIAVPKHPQIAPTRGLRLQGPPSRRSQRESNMPADLPTTKDLSVKDSDAETRKFHPQGSQRAPRGTAKPKPFDLAPKVWASLLNILNAAKLSHATKTTLKLEIGRIFTEGDSVPESWRCTKLRPANAFRPEDWSNIFHAHRQKGAAVTTFTPRITDHWCEAEHIIELEYADKSKVFKELPGLPEQRTRLLIHCADSRTNTQLIIEVGEEKEISVYRPHRETGSVNLHFPKRLWDARVIVNEEAIHASHVPDPFKSTVERLAVRGPVVENDLGSSIVASGKGDHVQIKAVEFHRDVIWPVAGKGFEGLEIFLTQVQSLAIDQRDDWFEAFLYPEGELRRVGRMWWEMSVRSPIVDARLRQQSAQTTMGTKMDYSQFPEVEEQCMSLVALAEKIVPQLDPVGLNTLFQTPVGSLSSSPHKRGKSSKAGLSIAPSQLERSREASRMRDSSLARVQE